MKRPEKRANLDYVLLIVLVMLIGAGLVLLYSTSAYNGQNKFQDAYYYVKKQGAATVLGVIGMLIVAKIDYHKWIPFANLGYLVSIILSVLVMLVGEEYNGSKRWLSLGPLSFQPSEFSKVAIILFLACLISGQKKCVDNWRSMLCLMLPVLPVTALVGASNLSTAIRYWRSTYFCCKSKVYTIYLDGDSRNRIYGNISGTGKLSTGKAGNMEKSGAIRKRISDITRTLCDWFRRVVWKRNWSKRSKAWILAGSTK